MKEIISKVLSKATKIPENEIIASIEAPSNSELGDYSFPCFSLAKKMKKNPAEIAKLISEKIQLIKE